MCIVYLGLESYHEEHLLHVNHLTSMVKFSRLGHFTQLERVV